MGRITKFLALCLVFTALLCCSSVTLAQTGVTQHVGALADGATYLIEVPAHWNGTLFLYSHGYVTPGAANPAEDVGDPATRAFMLGSGFALAGSSYATTGWAIQQALPDQIAVLDRGRIVEIGRHDELLALDGYYASLYQKQQLEEELTVAG